jgi:hypothetical protein
MSPSKPANPVRNYAVGSAIAALILLGPVAALIDLLIVGGTSAVCAVAAGGIGLALSRKFWQGHKVAHQSGPELVPGDTSIAAAPM